MPAELDPGRFFAIMVNEVLDASPVNMHKRARELRAEVLLHEGVSEGEFARVFVITSISGLTCDLRCIGRRSIRWSVRGRESVEAMETDAVSLTIYTPRVTFHVSKDNIWITLQEQIE